MTAYRGQLNDGRTAATVPVTVHPDIDGLALAKDDNTPVGLWRWADIRLIDSISDGRDIRLGNRTEPDARLRLEEQAIVPLLDARAPYLRRDPFDAKRLWNTLAIIGVLAATGALFFFGLPKLAQPLAMLVPKAWEEKVGRDTVDAVNTIFARGRPACERTEGRQALDRLSRRLTSAIDVPYDVHVTVADSSIVNAIAVPGGQIVLFRGLIEQAQSSEEVAGVLAHELAHVALRHPTRGAIASLGWAALISAFTGGASFSDEILARLAAHLATSAYTRELEAEADATAVAILDRTGIGGRSLASFFRSIEPAEARGPSIPKYLASHPLTGDRIATIERLSEATISPAMSPEDWQALRAVCQ